MKRILILFLFISIHLSSFAQEADTTLIQDTLRHSPAKATFMSLAVPGLGQLYNRKIWKVPLVYALIGTPLYFALDQRKKFEDFKSAYLKRVDNDPNTIDLEYQDVYTDQNLIDLIDYHRANRDLLFVLTGVAYALNVVDAAVDAHLYYFDVSDELSAEFKPTVKYSAFDRNFVPSLTLTLKIGKNNRQQY